MNPSGLTFREVKKLQKQYGPNTFASGQHKNRALVALLARFKNPLVVILLIAATLSLFFGDRASFFIITTIILLSVTLDFINTYRSEQAAEALKDKVRVKAQVIREGHEHTIAVGELVPGDIVLLRAGKLIPADGIIKDSKDLYCNESSLTGESFPQSKPPQATVYMGSGVASGTGIMEVQKTGSQTKFAHVVEALQSKHQPTAFEQEMKDFSILIIRITFVLVVFVFAINALFHHNLLESLLFSLALAVGLTPELLPLIITLNLTKGSLAMAKNGVIVKQLSAIQDFGSMDVLCTDKTGTLTEDRIVLVKYVDGQGESSDEVLKYGYLVSLFSTGFENPLDAAVRSYKPIEHHDYQKIDEIPFDFERKREAVVVHSDKQQERLLIVKGAPEEVLKICRHYRQAGKLLTAKQRAHIEQTYVNLSQNGFRVLAVATKKIHPAKRYEPSDEFDLCFQGFLAFLDPAKQSVASTLQLMERLGITIKIITGDNALVAQKIAQDIGLAVSGVQTGDDMTHLSDERLRELVEKTTIFARVNPEQKMHIIQALRKNGHVVGYMGDGINDAPSIQAADVGISVNNAVDVAKDAADFILLRKSLHELAEGVADGRKTFANTLKYLRMSLSSNFGNMFSMAAASLFLPFLPMLATQILLNNLLYDSSQFAIPLDNVDDAEIYQPQTLSIVNLKRFMWSYGLLSSVFDFITFATLLLLFHADEGIFQAGWFLESFLTQVLVVYIIRSRFGPAGRSRPGWALVCSTLATITVAILVIMLPLRRLFHFGVISTGQVAILSLIVVSYLLSAELLKHWFYNKETA